MKLSIPLITFLSFNNASGFTTLNTKPSLLSGTQLTAAAEGGEVNGAATNTNMAGRPNVKPLLDSVNSPSDMKNLDIRSLKQVKQ